jgi:hypothetical protein
MVAADFAEEDFDFGQAVGDFLEPSEDQGDQALSN